MGNSKGPKMTFVEKIDVLDLIINCLKEHEKTFDGLIDRLNKVVSVAERQAMR